MYKNIIFLVFILFLFIDDLYLLLSNITLIILIVLLIIIGIQLYNSNYRKSYKAVNKQLTNPNIINIINTSNINKNLLNKNKFGNKNLYN